MNKQPTVADVLHYAADKCLAYDKRYNYGYGLKEKYSCCAVTEAVYQLTGYLDVDGLSNRVLDGLKAMGCDTGSHALFEKYGDPVFFTETVESVQGMRYMWLKWAALMAEEQGV